MTNFSTNCTTSNIVIHFASVAVIPMLVHEISLGCCKGAEFVANRVIFLLIKGVVVFKSEKIREMMLSGGYMVKRIIQSVNAGWINGWNGWNGWTDGQVDRWTDGSMDRWIDGSMNGWMDGWMDGLID